MTKALVFNHTISTALSRRYLSIAVTIAILLHLTGIAVYYIISSFTIEDSIVIVRLTKYIDLPPPPSINQTNNLPIVNFNIPATIGKGIPVPVIDSEVNPDQTIASQTELSQLTNPINNILSGQENVEFILGQKINIEDEEPPDFVPVEKQPVAVKTPEPGYPEIARRTGLEGTVWVKILIDKEGKAKKAVIIKSDAEIFNEAAIQAALQWVFTPAMMNNGPVQVWAAVPFRFKLNK
ncbi:MAG: energy transducer TonB [Patescibacteria group bacterium]